MNRSLTITFHKVCFAIQIMCCYFCFPIGKVKYSDQKKKRNHYQMLKNLGFGECLTLHEGYTGINIGKNNSSTFYANRILIVQMFMNSK